MEGLWNPTSDKELTDDEPIHENQDSEPLTKRLQLTGPNSLMTPAATLCKAKEKRKALPYKKDKPASAKQALSQPSLPQSTLPKRSNRSNHHAPSSTEQALDTDGDPMLHFFSQFDEAEQDRMARRCLINSDKPEIGLLDPMKEVDKEDRSLEMDKCIRIVRLIGETGSTVALTLSQYTLRKTTQGWIKNFFHWLCNNFSVRKVSSV